MRCEKCNSEGDSFPCWFYNRVMCAACRDSFPSMDEAMQWLAHGYPPMSVWTYQQPEGGPSLEEVRKAAIESMGKVHCVLPRGTMEQLTTHSCGFSNGPAANFCAGCGERLRGPSQISGVFSLLHHADEMQKAIEQQFAYSALPHASDLMPWVCDKCQNEYGNLRTTTREPIFDEDGVTQIAVRRKLKYKCGSCGNSEESISNHCFWCNAEDGAIHDAACARPPIKPSRFVKASLLAAAKKINEATNSYLPSEALEAMANSFVSANDCTCASLINGHEPTCPHAKGKS